MSKGATTQRQNTRSLVGSGMVRAELLALSAVPAKGSPSLWQREPPGWVTRGATPRPPLGEMTVATGERTEARTPAGLHRTLRLPSPWPWTGNLPRSERPIDSARGQKEKGHSPALLGNLTQAVEGIWPREPEKFNSISLRTRASQWSRGPGRPEPQMSRNSHREGCGLLASSLHPRGPGQPFLCICEVFLGFCWFFWLRLQV